MKCAIRDLPFVESWALCSTDPLFGSFVSLVASFFFS